MLHSDIKINAYSHQGEIAMMLLSGSESKNKSGEEVGKISVILNDRSLATLKLDTLVQSMGLPEGYAENSLLEKLTLLTMLKEKSFKSLDVVLEGGADLPSEAAIAKLVQESVFKVSFMHTPGILAPSKARSKEIKRTSRVRNFHTASTNNAAEANISAALYNKIKQLYSYSPDGKGAKISRSAFMQIIPNGIPIDLDIFKNKPPMSPLNPLGDLTTTEEFAGFADLFFDIEGKKTDKQVSKIYGEIVNNINSTQPINENDQNLLEKVQGYLKVEVTDPITGEKKLTDSPAYVAYQQAQDDLADALAKYMDEKFDYDLSDPVDQKKWQKKQISLNREIEKAKSRLNAVSTTIERALEFQKSYGKNAVQYMASNAQNTYSQCLYRSQVTQGTSYPICYGLPSNWYETNSGFSHMSISTKNTNEEQNAETAAYGGGASFSKGLISIEAEVNGQQSTTHMHTSTLDIGFTFDVGTVSIQRPWLNSVIFNLAYWNYGGQPAGTISSGAAPFSDPKVNDRLLPYYPTAFIIAKNIKVTGDWSDSDRDTLQKSISGKTSIGIGPFKLSGANYSRGSQSSSFNSSVSNGEFTVPGAQIIGVINTIVPFSAPEGL